MGGMELSEAEALGRAAAADHAVLGTLRPDGRIDLVPACFAIDGDLVAIPIDRVKPKRGSPLQRERNLATEPRATLLCERWDAEDWSRLWWVRLRLERSDEPPRIVERLEAAIRDRYPQYRSEPFVGVLTFRIRAVDGWSAA